MTVETSIIIACISLAASVALGILNIVGKISSSSCCCMKCRTGPTVESILNNAVHELSHDDESTHGYIAGRPTDTDDSADTYDE